MPPPLESRGIAFRRGAVTRLEPQARRVFVDCQTLENDFLLIAARPRPHCSGVPGFGWHQGHTNSVRTLDEALAAQKHQIRLPESPGAGHPGHGAGVGLFPHRRGVRAEPGKRVRVAGEDRRGAVTVVTPEPFLGHFGIGGFGRAGEVPHAMFDMAGITPSWTRPSLA